MRECTFEQGHGNWSDWLVTRVGGQQLHITKREIYQDFRNQVILVQTKEETYYRLYMRNQIPQMLFFCGNDPDCLSFNSETALKRAKRVAEREFAVVGVLERLDDTLAALEGYVPRYT